MTAALALADADSEDDLDYHRRLCRFRAALNAYADQRALERARQEARGGPGPTIASTAENEEGRRPLAVPAASCGPDVRASCASRG